jgi:hypothetical protein
MLIKFFPNGTGGGSGPVDYVTARDRQGREDAAPEILRGDPEQTRDLIDGIERKWRYTSGVVSFALDDDPTDAQQEHVMDEFERAAFAGLSHDQHDILWVRHSHTEGGRVELHFVVPRVELLSGKALNIAPPGWENHFAPLKDALNFEHGWARPDDPARAREQQHVQERPVRMETREEITKYLTNRIEDGAVTDRAGIVQALVDVGLEITREGKDYVSVSDPESEQKFRLKGSIYEAGWTAKQFDRAIASENGSRQTEDRGIDSERAQIARQKLERSIAKRTEFNAGHYPRPVELYREFERIEAASHSHQNWADRGGAEALAAMERSRSASDRPHDLDWALGIDGNAARDVERLAERYSFRREGASRAESPDRGHSFDGGFQRDVSGASEGDGHGEKLRLQGTDLHQIRELEADGSTDSFGARAFESFRSFARNPWGGGESPSGQIDDVQQRNREADQSWQEKSVADRERVEREAVERVSGLRAENADIGESVSRLGEFFQHLGQKIDRFSERSRTAGFVFERIQRAADTFRDLAEVVNRWSQRVETQVEQQKAEQERQRYRGQGMER